jgi:hypothetical protein
VDISGKPMTDTILQPPEGGKGKGKWTQYSQDEEIEGSYRIDAKGGSLEKHLQYLGEPHLDGILQIVGGF